MTQTWKPISNVVDDVLKAIELKLKDTHPEYNELKEVIENGSKEKSSC